MRAVAGVIPEHKESVISDVPATLLPQDVSRFGECWGREVKQVSLEGLLTSSRMVKMHFDSQNRKIICILNSFNYGNFS